MKTSVDYEYLARIRGMVNLYTRRKASGMLEGGFRSTMRGRSLEFDDLKEYSFGDDVHDIDWKSSSRTGKVLVRRYLAERRHNVLFVGDTGPKMSGHTPRGEEKAELALLTFATIAYLLEKQGADCALSFAGRAATHVSYFRSGMDHIESELRSYEAELTGIPHETIDRVLDRAADQLRRRMIVVVITDLAGLASMNERLVKKLTFNNDLLVICLEDAMLSSGALKAGTGKVFDVDDGRYAGSFFSGSRRLQRAEKEDRRKRLEDAQRLLVRYHAGLTMVNGEEELLGRVMELFERQRAFV